MEIRIEAKIRAAGEEEVRARSMATRWRRAENEQTEQYKTVRI